jgi:methionyl-tRNA formyltransferase
MTRENRRVSVLVDNDSWILPYADRLVVELRESGFDAQLVRHADDLKSGWVCFLLGCVYIVKDSQLARNRLNLVVHESDLPKGRGFAPMAWQILDGARSIPVCLLEASSGEPDAGDIWIRDRIELSGHEMLPEWRRLQGEKTVELCLRFVQEYQSLVPTKQTGEPTWFKRRRPEDSELDPHKSLIEQFNLLRVVDNERYPAFFQVAGKKVVIKVGYEGENELS